MPEVALWSILEEKPYLSPALAHKQPNRDHCIHVLERSKTKHGTAVCTVHLARASSVD